MDEGEKVEIVPAILAKTQKELKEKLSRVDFAPMIQVDLMDGDFVPNKTIGLEAAQFLPKEKVIEYHLMVSEPLEWIEKLPDGPNSIFQVHVEARGCSRINEILDLVKRKGSRLCAALNPESGPEMLEKCIFKFEEVLVMTVHPGRSGQSYIYEMGDKISSLREKYPDIIIEVDGGLNEDTVKHAVGAGANRIVAASAIFSKKNAHEAYKKLEKMANESAQE